MELYPYQQSFTTALSAAVKKFLRVIGCLPTGGGKTVVFTHIALRAIEKGFTVLILTESRKIFSQIITYAKGHQINAGVKHLFILPGYTYIAMAQTLNLRPEIIKQLSALGNKLLIINDESHIGTATKLLKKLPDAYLLGFTATPDYRAAKHLPELYNACVVGPQVQDLIQTGHLSPYIHYARIGAHLDELQIKNGEFTEESQKRAFETKEVYKGLIEDLRKVPHTKSLIFASSIQHCEDIAAELRQEGLQCVTIHSKNEETANTSNMFYFRLDHNRPGAKNICVSVGVLTKGWDYPALDLIAILRATNSLPLYLQMCGRGSRIFPGKKSFTVLDYGENFKRHGLWDMDREWGTMWKADKVKRKKKDKEQLAPVKECPKCKAILPAAATRCNFCGYVFPQKEKELQEGALVMINEKYQPLIGRQISSLTPQELAVFARLKNKKTFAARIAKAKEQEQPGWLRAYGEEMGYKQGWAEFQEKLMPKEKIDYHDLLLK